MGVVAVKTVGSQQIQYEFECGAFDLMMETDPSNGWAEVSRDCDQWVNRWALYPYASGNKGRGSNSFNTSGGDPRLPFRKYFPSVDDGFNDVLDFSDINEGLLPTAPCSQMDLNQNGKKLPCEAYTINYGAKTITIDAEWNIPGAAYEAIYYAPLYIPPGT